MENFSKSMDNIPITILKLKILTRSVCYPVGQAGMATQWRNVQHWVRETVIREAVNFASDDL